MYRLYSIPGSCSSGIHVLLNKLGQSVEVVRRDEVEDYAEIVPTNQVPALVFEDELLTEGAAIAQFLLEEHGMAPLPGRETREFRQWLLFNYATLHPTYSKLFMVGSSAAVEQADNRQALIDEIAERLSTLWAIVERRLQGREAMAGDAPSIVDYLLAVYANWGNSFPGARVVIGPVTRKHIQKVIDLPEFQRTIALEGITVQLPT